MAYDPKIKARAVADLTMGDTWEAVRVRYGKPGKPLAKDTLAGWVREAKEALKTQTGLVLVDCAPETGPKKSRPKSDSKPDQKQTEIETGLPAKESPKTPYSPSIPTPTYPTVLEARRTVFTQELMALLMDGITMTRAWLRECTDPEFIRKNPAGCNLLGSSASEKALQYLGFIDVKEEGVG